MDPGLWSHWHLTPGRKLPQGRSIMQQGAGQGRQDNCINNKLYQMATGLHGPVVIGGLKVSVDGMDELSFGIIYTSASPVCKLEQVELWVDRDDGGVFP